MIEEQQIFEHFLYVLPLLNDLLTTDVGVSLVNKEKFLYYKPGKMLDLKISRGDSVKENTPIFNAMHQKKRLFARIDNIELFGQPFIAICLPIVNGAGDVIGAISVSEAVQKYDNMKNLAAQMVDSISIIAGSSEEVAAQAEEISALSKSVAIIAGESQKNAKDADQVISFIRNVSQQTNLLGLNAAIEAARAGDQGRGFGVVAEEIRKLSSSTNDSIRKIEKTIKAIQVDSSDIFKQIGQIDDVLNQIVSATNHLANTLQDISSVASHLNDASDFV